MMIIVRYFYLILICCLVAPFFALAKPKGITFSSTRIIYPEENTGGSALSIINNTERVFLISARVLYPGTDPASISANAAPFVALPPVGRLEANGRRELRVIRTGGDLPEDRESLFYLSLKILPALTHSPVNNDRLGLGVVWNSKIFYRPGNLPADGVAGALKQLRLRRISLRQLQLVNPSPFWLTFSSLRSRPLGDLTGGKPLMMAPDSTITVSLPAGSAWRDDMENTVEIRVLDENGKDVSYGSVGVSL